MVDQIRRAAVSVSSNIAEGYERGTKAELIQFLYVARGSCGEVRSQLAIAQEVSYIAKESLEKHYELCIATSRQISGLIEYIKDVKMKGQKFQTPQDKSREAFLKLLAQYSKYGKPSG